jgi:hypothetical protein
MWLKAPVCARLPEHKLKLVQALQHRGMLCDDWHGVNAASRRRKSVILGNNPMFPKKPPT